jgi:hypothetical protein
MRRPTIGTLVLLVGFADLVFTVLLFARQLADIGSVGVLGAVMFDQRAGREAAALWFGAKGVLVVAVGQLARAHERVASRLPEAPGWMFIALGALGAIIAPMSGFWVYIALGALWISDSRKKRGDRREGTSR